MFELARKFIRKVRLKKQNHTQCVKEKEEIAFEISGSNCRVKTEHDEFKIEVQLHKSVYRIEKVSLLNSKEICSQQDGKEYPKQKDCCNVHEPKDWYYNKSNGIICHTDESLDSGINSCIYAVETKICQPSEEFQLVSGKVTSVTPCHNEDEYWDHGVTQSWNNLDLEQESNTSERIFLVDEVSLSHSSDDFETSSENGDTDTDSLNESESVLVKEVHSESNFPEEKSTLLKRQYSQSEIMQQAAISEWVNESRVITGNSNVQPNLETFGSHRELRSQSYEFCNLHSLKENKVRNDLNSEYSNDQKVSSYAHKCIENVPLTDFHLSSSYGNCSLSLENINLGSPGSTYEDQILETKFTNEESSSQLQSCDDVKAGMESYSEETGSIGIEESSQLCASGVVQSQENILLTEREDESNSSRENCHVSVGHANGTEGNFSKLEYQDGSTGESLVESKEERELESRNMQDLITVSVETVFTPVKQILVFTHQNGNKTEMSKKLKLRIVTVDAVVYMADVWTWYYFCCKIDTHSKSGSHDRWWESASSTECKDCYTAGKVIEINKELLQLKNEMMALNHCKGNAMEVLCNEMMKMKADLAYSRNISHDRITLEMEKFFKNKALQDCTSRDKLLCLARNNNVMYVNSQGRLELKKQILHNLRIGDVMKYQNLGEVLQMVLLAKNHINSQKCQGQLKRSIQVIEADHPVEGKLKIGMVLPEFCSLILLQARIQNLVGEYYNTEEWKCYESVSDMKSTTGAVITNMADTNTLLVFDWWLSVYKSYPHGGKTQKYKFSNETWDQFENMEDIFLFYGTMTLKEIYHCYQSCLQFIPATCCRDQELTCGHVCETLCQSLHRNVKDSVDCEQEGESERKSSKTSDKKTHNFFYIKETLCVCGLAQLKLFLSSVIFGRRIQKVDYEENSLVQDRQQIGSETLDRDPGEDSHERNLQNSHYGCVQNNIQHGNGANVNYLGETHVQEDPSNQQVQEDIGALISESASRNYSSSSSTLTPQYVIYLRLIKNTNSVTPNQRTEEVRIRAPRNLSAEEMEKIRIGTIKFFRDYYKSEKCERNGLPSLQEVETMSIPDLLYLVQSIPKGLSFLHAFLKISSELRIDSLIEVRPIERNIQALAAQQQQETDLDNFLQQVVDGDDEAVQSRMRLEWFRIITFQTYPANVGISTLKLAKNGFYYTGHTTETRCYFCRQTYNEWSEESDIEAVHRQISPDCPFINGRQTSNAPIHGTRRNDSPVPDSNVDSLQRAATEHLRNLNVERTGTSSNTMALPQDQARQSPQPAPYDEASASADATGVDQGSEHEPASIQTPSKSKLKRDKKKKKKEEQAKAKAAASTNQGAGGSVIHEVPHSEEEVVPSIQSEASVTTSSSSEPTPTPGLTVEQIQPHSRSLEASHGEGAQATSVSITPNVPPVSTQSRQSSQTSSSQNTTNTRSSSSSANRQGGANPPGPSQGGANPPAPTSAERLAQLDPLGINFDKPKYPAYAVYSTRLSSFEGWPSHMAQTPREMARAGYFYAGYGDYARCFFCGGGLRNWDRTDEPWIEHAKWFPRCAFLRNNKGDKYVARVQRRHQEQEAGLEPSSQLPPPVERDMETSIAQALREMGYNNQIIQRAMNDWRRNLRPGRRHPPPMTASAILDIIEILESQEQVNTQRPRETPLIIPGVDSLAGEVNRVHLGNDGESMNSLGASALDENRTDARLDDQPREYGYDQREKQEKQILQEDFLGLTETIVCKVCCDKDVAAAFLPCGHLVCCLDCAPAMRKCPLCGELIKGTVKTYFA